MTPTPLTDAEAVREYGLPQAKIRVEFARGLERKADYFRAQCCDADKALDAIRAEFSEYPTGTIVGYIRELKAEAKHPSWSDKACAHHTDLERDRCMWHCPVCLKQERDHWKAAHDNQVNLRRALVDRPDLKERAVAVAALDARAQLAESRLKKLAQLAWESRGASDEPSHMVALGIVAECRSGDFKTLDAWSFNE